MIIERVCWHHLERCCHDDYPLAVQEPRPACGDPDQTSAITTAPPFNTSGGTIFSHWTTVMFGFWLMNRPCTYVLDQFLTVLHDLRRIATKYAVISALMTSCCPLQRYPARPTTKLRGVLSGKIVIIASARACPPILLSTDSAGGQMRHTTPHHWQILPVHRPRSHHFRSLNYLTPWTHLEPI